MIIKKITKRNTLRRKKTGKNEKGAKAKEKHTEEKKAELNGKDAAIEPLEDSLIESMSDSEEEDNETEETKEKEPLEDLNNDKERNTKKQEVKTQYCMNHIYGVCSYRERCWRKHVSPREFKKTIRCKYFERGTCQKGGWCNYKHLKNATCKYYARGNCARGDTCTYRHIKIEKPEDKPEDPPAINKEDTRPNTNKDDKKTNKGNMEKEIENFPKDARMIDQITKAVNHLMKSEELKILLKSALENVIQGDM